MDQNLSDREKLNFNLNQWSQNDLCDFLITNYFTVSSTQTMRPKDVEAAYLATQERLGKKYATSAFIFLIVDGIFSILRHNKKSILFQSTKYAHLIMAAKKQHPVTIFAQGRKDRLFAILHGIGYVGANELDAMVLGYLKEKEARHFHQLLSCVEKKLKKINPACIVLWDDGLPIGRALVLTAKKLGIKTMVIQNGIYDSFAVLRNELVADYILSWGEFFKQLFLKDPSIQAENVHVLGYPYPMRKNPSAGNMKKVCYLGQDFERLNKGFLEIKLQTLQSLSLICDKLGLEFMYRPHPGDMREFLQEKLPHVRFTPKNESLEETLASADILVSASSTSLIEAAMRSKISLQLANYPIKLDNFEELGVSQKTFDSLDDLKKYLESMMNGSGKKGVFVFNNNYMETNHNLNQRFLEILDRILTP